MNMLPTSSTFFAFLALVLGFGFIIFIHELGHFLAAKWVKIKVTQFAVGFGQSMLTWRKGIGFRVGSTEAEYDKRVAAKLAEQGRAGVKLDATQEGQLIKEMGLGETEYRLNWIPLGGYVKMLGQEDLSPDATSEDPRSFNARPIWARAVVVSAGVIMNLISAVIFFIIAFSAGVAFPPAIAGPVYPTAPAGLAYAQGHEGEAAYRGLQPGDQILAINDQPMGDFMEVAVSSALSSPGAQLNLKVQRHGEKTPLNYVLVAKPDARTNLLSLGILPPRDVVLERVPQQGPAAQPTLKPPVVAIEADGQPINGFGDYYRIVAGAQGKPVSVTFAEYDAATKTAGSKTTVVQVSASPMLSPRSSEDSLPDLIGLTPVTYIEDVMDESPAKAAGIKSGDLIAQLGAVAWPDPDTLRDAVAEADGKPIKIVVQREGKLVDLGEITPDHKNQLGIYLNFAMDFPVISKTLANSPASKSLELTPGSTITEIDGKKVNTWADMQRLFASAAAALPEDGGNIEVGYQLNMAGTINGNAQVKIDKAQRQRLLMAQWVPHLVEGFADLREDQVASSVWDAAKLGVVKTKHYMLQTYVTLVRLFQGTVKASHLRGPVGIAYEGTRVAKLGWTYLLFFLGLISVNLAVVNFLPIPVVDGGLMVFLILEKIKGSPVNVKVQNFATIVGLALILSIFVVTLFYDLSRLVS